MQKKIDVRSIWDDKKIIVILVTFVSILIASLSSINPIFSLGFFLVLIFLFFALISPKLFLMFIFFTGGIPFAFLTQRQKPFFAELGGINVDGIRLIGFVFIMLIYLSMKAKDAFNVASRFRLYIIFLIFAGISITYTMGRPVDGFRLFFKLLYPFLIFIILQIEVKQMSDVRWIKESVIYGGIFVTLIGMINILRGNAFIKGLEGVTQYTAGLAHPNMISFYFLLLFLFSFINYVYYKRKYYLIISVIFFLQIAITFTRISMAALVVGLMIIVFRKQNILKGAVVATLILGIVFLALLNVPSIKNRMFYHPEKVTYKSMFSKPGEVFLNIRYTGRKNLWSYALENTFKKKPWTGSGLGSADIIIGREWEKLGINIDVTGGVPVHNEYIRVLCEMGIVGLFIFLFSNLKFTIDQYRLLKKARRDPQLCQFSLIAFVAMVCYLIISTTSNVFNWYAIFSQFVFAFMALAYKMHEMKEEEILHLG
jgi:O-antigen ligase